VHPPQTRIRGTPGRRAAQPFPSPSTHLIGPDCLVIYGGGGGSRNVKSLNVSASNWDGNPPPTPRFQSEKSLDAVWGGLVGILDAVWGGGGWVGYFSGVLFRDGWEVGSTSMGNGWLGECGEMDNKMWEWRMWLEMRCHVKQ